MEWISNPEIWISLLTLTVLEIVLGIDNIIFISILSGKLPAAQQRKARQWGLGLALITRIILLCGLAWVVKLDKPFWEPTIFSFKLAVSGKDIILILGGLFLLGKSTYEIHEKLEGVDGEKTEKMMPTFNAVLVQIMLLDIVFSLDSVITAVGMVKQIGVMIAAVMFRPQFVLRNARVSAVATTKIQAKTMHVVLRMAVFSMIMITFGSQRSWWFSTSDGLATRIGWAPRRLAHAPARRR